MQIESSIEGQLGVIALKFLDDFYKTINEPKKAKSEFQWQCQ